MRHFNVQTYNLDILIFQKIFILMLRRRVVPIVLPEYRSLVSFSIQAFFVYWEWFPKAVRFLEYYYCLNCLNALYTGEGDLLSSNIYLLLIYHMRCIFAVWLIYSILDIFETAGFKHIRTLLSPIWLNHIYNPSICGMAFLFLAAGWMFLSVHAMFYLDYMWIRCYHSLTN